MTSKVTLSIIGAGSLGLDAYANYALARPDLCEVVAVADPREAYRESRREGVDKTNPDRRSLEFSSRRDCGQ